MKFTITNVVIATSLIISAPVFAVPVPDLETRSPDVYGLSASVLDERQITCPPEYFLKDGHCMPHVTKREVALETRSSSEGRPIKWQWHDGICCRPAWRHGISCIAERNSPSLDTQGPQTTVDDPNCCNADFTNAPCIYKYNGPFNHFPGYCKLPLQEGGAPCIYYLPEMQTKRNTDADRPQGLKTTAEKRTAQIDHPCPSEDGKPCHPIT